MPFNLIFAGTPEFSVPTLTALLNSPHTVRAVYTQPDRPAGRGRRMQASPVKQLAEAAQLPIYQPLSLRDADAQATLQAIHADLMIVVAYGLLLPQTVLDHFPLGCINIHASLLPRWRGAAPIQRALLAGDTVSGITIMQMEKGLDTGAMLEKITCPIEPQDTAATLHDRLATLGPLALLNVLTAFERGALRAEPQNPEEACYAPKLTKQEANLDWQASANDLARCVRAYNPWPIAYTYLNQDPLRIWEAEPLPQLTQAIPGTLLAATAQGIDIATGSGILRLKQLQFPGGKPLACADLLHAKQALFSPGICFTSTPC